jgi:exopolyphosphatase/pppGpp-phosphohydrolase
MTKARKYGALGITGTLRGNLELSYENGSYRLSNFNNGELIVEGAPKVVAPVLAAAYEVVLA